MKKKIDWRQYELEEQIRTGFGWEDYDPEHYGWEKSRIISLQAHYNLELAQEIGPTTIPHKTRKNITINLDNSDRNTVQ